MASSQQLPTEYNALLLHSTGKPLELTKLPFPTASAGSAIIKVLTTGVMSYSGEVLSGKRPYPYPTPYAPGGAGCVGYVAAVGPDATTLRPGDLVLADSYLIARDDANSRCLQGIHQGGTAGSARLVENEWRHGSWAEYVKVPLENCHRLPNDGRNVNDWINMSLMMVPFGGMTNDGGLDLRPGESVVIAPATGQFSGAAVEVALAMGAKVVALGRNLESLRKLKEGLSEFGLRLRTVQITGDVEADAKSIGPVDCYFDISPPFAADSTHFKSCFQALKPKGRVCLMGGIQHDISIPHGKIYRQGITITGKWMYEPDAAKKLIQMVDAGLLNLGRYTCEGFPLEHSNQAIDNAGEKAKWGRLTVLKPYPS